MIFKLRGFVIKYEYSNIFKSRAEDKIKTLSCYCAPIYKPMRALYVDECACICGRK